MEALQLFEHPQFGTVRVVMRDGDPWFTFVEVCEVMGFRDPLQILSSLDEDEKDTCFLEGERATIISESGLFGLALRSREPETEAFLHWVTHEVIPQVRTAAPLEEATRKNVRLSVDNQKLRKQIIGHESFQSVVAMEPYWGGYFRLPLPSDRFECIRSIGRVMRTISYGGTDWRRRAVMPHGIAEHYFEIKRESVLGMRGPHKYDLEAWTLFVDYLKNNPVEKCKEVFQPWGLDKYLR